MNVKLPGDLEQWVDQRVKEGHYPSSEAALTEALELLQRRDARREEVRMAIQEGIDDADAGRTVPLTDELIEDVIRRGKERLTEAKRSTA
ncbi:MAG: type II toxin-antitoxin system ParD family antitoxin [Phycisphaera sp.]|nr:type II toxin-antitoxin system ParD family antitoxin [Phycisphaera sp.]